jgi:hypothetical protein
MCRPITLPFCSYIWQHNLNRHQKHIPVFECRWCMASPFSKLTD